MNLFESLRAAREAGNWALVRVLENVIAAIPSDDLIHDITKRESFEDTNLELAMDVALLDALSLELEVAA